MERQKLKELPNNPEVEALVAQSEQLHDIKALYETPGGKTLFNLLITDVVARVNALEASYKTASHSELIALCANLSSYLQLARRIANAEENEKVVDEAIKEALS